MLWHNIALPPLRLASRAWRLPGTPPASPPGYLLAQYALVSLEEFVTDGEDKLEIVRRVLDDSGVALPEAPRILDFGCGLGSTLLAFQRNLPSASCYGCDVKNDAIRWLASNHDELTVTRNNPLPPLPDEFSGFDFIYAISVWTHMPEASCSAWIAHMHSRLNPRGGLFFTFVEPSTDLVLRYGFDPNTHPTTVQANSGCLFDPATDMTFIQKEWVERQAEGKFEVRYLGPTDYAQWGALLQRPA
jgi:SAM-dependent methyltransferase